MKRWLRILLFLLVLFLLLVCAIWFWPPPDPISAPQESALDIAMPMYHHREVHEVQACAAPEAIDRALREVKAIEIPGFELLMGIRDRRGQSSNAARQLPILDAMKHANFVSLADLPRQEILYGTAGPFWQLRGARGPLYGQIRQGLKAVEGVPEKFASLEIEGAAKAAINFRVVHVVGEQCPRLVTETRIFCGNPQELRAFTRYWRVIAPGSAILRRNWLDAVVRRATRS